MKLYDIALVLIRTLVAVEFLRTVLSIVMDDIIALSGMAQTSGIWTALTVRWQVQAYELGAPVLLWFLSKTIARFVVRFVESPS